MDTHLGLLLAIIVLKMKSDFVLMAKSSSD